jgi:hypothetical protein
LVLLAYISTLLSHSLLILADPSHPESALNSIPKPILQRARGVSPCSRLASFIEQHIPGLAIFQVLKAGFVFSGKAGSGLVIARLPDGSWSAPSCIATGGVGWGLQIGADITDFVVVLNSEDAVRAFSMGGNVTIGGNISAAAGPLGTGASVQASLAHPAPMFSYSKSKGAPYFYSVAVELNACSQVSSQASRLKGPRSLSARMQTATSTALRSPQRTFLEGVFHLQKPLLSCTRSSKLPRVWMRQDCQNIHTSLDRLRSSRNQMPRVDITLEEIRQFSMQITTHECNQYRSLSLVSVYFSL